MGTCGVMVTLVPPTSHSFSVAENNYVFSQKTGFETVICPSMILLNPGNVFMRSLIGYETNSNAVEAVFLEMVLITITAKIRQAAVNAKPHSTIESSPLF